jgi:microcystin-dependent protein
MPGFPVPFIKFREDTANGFPLAGGKLWSYAAGTSTPLATYTTHIVDPLDPSAVPNTNPVILDAQGRANVFVQDGVGYKFTLTDALDNLIWTQDNVMVPEIEPAPVPSAVPPGGIVMYGAATAPAGWLLCNGAAVSRSTYSGLFAIIGETFGAGNGSTTFNTPDFRQRMPLGVAASGTGNVLGLLGIGGAIDHTHTGPSHTHVIDAHVHEMAAHTHTVPHNGWTTAETTPPNAGVLQAGGSGVGSESTVGQATAANVTGGSAVTNTALNTGASLATQAGGTAVTGTANPPFLPVYFIIKT